MLFAIIPILALAGLIGGILAACYTLANWEKDREATAKLIAGRLLSLSKQG